VGRSDTEARISAYVDAHADEMVHFLQRVVATPSIWGQVPELARVAHILGDYLAHAGVHVDYTDSGTPGAPNLLARTGDAASARTLIFNGHFDVYPPSQSWSFDPFSTPVRDGRVYGPGATDMKGGTTAMVLAASVLSALRLPENGTVVVLAVPNHFEGGEGTRRALDAGLTADACIVCEPTDLEICSSQRGILYLDVTVKGIAAHTTHVEVGVNAIEQALPLLQALRSAEFLKPDNDEFGAEKILNVAMIEGGVKRCLIPERCRITLDVRFSPSTTAQRVLAEVHGLIERLAHRDPKFHATVEPQDSCVRNPRSSMGWVQGPLNEIIAAAHRSFGTEPARVSCHPAWPDTPIFNERGIPAITYGPGSKHCYWDEEFVRIDEFLRAVKVYCATAANFCRYG
jgi:acetylornithine deacetylase/succinyl-diaminopimelate desuccinylase-like protein